jgi:o-succinylbenzoate---CoA ligase
MHIDWYSSENHVLLNPRLPLEEQNRIQLKFGQYTHIKGHFWISTSGSTGKMKWAALSKEAILASAQAVNVHMQSTQKDCWIHCLPEFHVGGLGILARAFLSGAKVIFCKWDPVEFTNSASRHQSALTALVPAQIYDLVLHKIPAPSSMRAVIVGGGILQEELYYKGLELGWKLLPSYGLTECASQVATAPIDSDGKCYPKFQVLSHVQAKINDAGFICLKSPALLTGYACDDDDGVQFFDPKQNDWFQTEDLGCIENGFFKVAGRSTNFIKIGGESVDMLRLEKILEALKLYFEVNVDCVLIPFPDARLGHVIHFVTQDDKATMPLVEVFQEKVLPFERIRRIHVAPCIPRTSLGKLRKAELLNFIMPHS